MREGINWQMVEYKTNSATIQLIDKARPSIFSIINDATNAASGDTALLRNLHSTLAAPDLSKKLGRTYIRPKQENGTFGVKHYAGR